MSDAPLQQPQAGRMRLDTASRPSQRQWSRIQHEVRHVQRRVRSKAFWSLLAVLGVVASLFALMFRAAQASGQIDATTCWVLIGGVSVLAVVVSWALARRIAGGPAELAARIESLYPGLGQRLLTAVELPQDGADSPLAQHLIRETHDHFRSHPWRKVVPSASLWSARFSACCALGAIAAISLLEFSRERETLQELAELGGVPVARDVQVVPGDTSLERGTSLVVTAEFKRDVPEAATLVAEFADGSSREVPMKQNLGDPIVGGFLSSVDQPLRYRIEAKGWSSDTYSVDVFEFPRLVRSDAQLSFPEYTGMQPRSVEDTVKVSVAEGSEVTWLLRLNKPVDACRLEPEQGEPIDCRPLSGQRGVSSGGPATGEPAELATYAVDLQPQRSSTWTLRLRDGAGRENKFPPRLSVEILPNQPPQLELEQPRDVTVSPLQELSVKASVQDDYGVAKTGLSYAVQGRDEVTVDFDPPSGRNSAATLEHLLDFEALQAEPNDLLSYYFWAEDMGPDGQPRRTQSDLFFADVRPFEEIFRQGQSPPSGQGQGGQAQQAGELVKLQRQITTAIWNQMRQASDGKLVDAEDIKTIQQSQQEVLGQFKELASKLTDAESKRIAEGIFETMGQTIERLEQPQLAEARQASLASFSGLLKLRSREFQVSRSRQQQGGGGGASQSRQRQIDELELDEDENRYETQQQASQNSAQQQAAAEDRQVLSRLRELAQRTEDLMEELAKLQTALEQAESEEEQEQIRRRLKRLREQQQELLRMSDELESRMRSPENSDRMGQQADQLQRSRQELRQASKATEQSDTSAALAAGRRAEEQLNELQEEFRQRAAGAFDETVREMQREAERLEEQQQKISQSMKQEVEQASPGLRGDEQSDAAPEQLERQAEQLGELLDQMQQTVQAAEEAEPLLAEKLYEAFRDTRQAQTEQQLNNAAELVRRGFTPQAEPFERKAAESIQQLRQNIDQAADAVLGDSTEGLRRAAQQLDQLSRGVDQELAREAGIQPKASGERRGSSAQQPGQSAAESHPGPDGEQGTPAQSPKQESPKQESPEQESPEQQGSEQQGSEQQGSAARSQGNRDEQTERRGGSSGSSGSSQQQQQQQQQGSPQGQQPGRGQPSESSGAEGQQGERQEGQQADQPNAEGRPGEQASEPPGDQPSDAQRSSSQPGSEQGDQQGAGQQPSPQAGGQGRQQAGGSSQSQSGGRRPAPGLRGDSPGRSGRGEADRERRSESNRWAAESPSGGGAIGPITGDFRTWSDRMRDVEEMVDDPELRGRAMTIRDRVRQMRGDMKRHGEQPQWELVDEMIAQPLRELKREVRAELLRRTAAKNQLVPIDRDPVPAEFSEAVQRYYENLGSTNPDAPAEARR